MAQVYTLLHIFITFVLMSNVLSTVNDNGQSNSVNMVQSISSNDNLINEDSGHLVSCLGLKSETFNVTWSPKILKTDETVKFYTDIILSQQFSKGKVCVQIWIDDIPDPIYDDCRVQFCDQFIQVVQPYIPLLKCPIPQGFHLKQVFPLKIVPTIPLPAGNYKVKLEVWNENDVHTLCCTGDIEIDD
jgi:hypothetical protein